MADGRVRRGIQNRHAIVDAIYALIEEGALEPTAEEVAARARLGVRSVFRHFREMDVLRAEVSARVTREVLPTFDMKARSDDPAGRVRELVTCHTAAFERLMPFRRAGDVVVHRSPFLQGEQTRFDRFLRVAIQKALAAELAECDAATLETIDLLLSFQAWLRLRGAQGLSLLAARRLLERSIQSALEAGAAAKRAARGSGGGR